MRIISLALALSGLTMILCLILVPHITSHGGLSRSTITVKVKPYEIKVVIYPPLAYITTHTKEQSIVELFYSDLMNSQEVEVLIKVETLETLQRVNITVLLVGPEEFKEIIRDMNIDVRQWSRQLEGVPSDILMNFVKQIRRKSIVEQKVSEHEVRINVPQRAVTIILLKSPFSGTHRFELKFSIIERVIATPNAFIKAILVALLGITLEVVERGLEKWRSLR